MATNKVLEFLRIFTICLSVFYIPTSILGASEFIKREAGLLNYGILLDGGSSSTKLNIYRWNTSGHTVLPALDLINNIKFDPGISDFEKDIKGLTTYIKNILSRAKQEVPESKYSGTPIFFMATAGLRFFSARSVKVVLANIRSIMTNKAVNPFLYTPTNVRLLSGEREGAYSWISANYLLGFFDKKRPHIESVGVLEMGGGSTQITFIPNGPLFGEEYQVTVAGRAYQLYVQSYLQYGANAIKLKVAHVLSQYYPDQDEVENPCILRGDSVRTTQLDNGRMLIEKGSGQPEFCVKLLQEILKPHTGINCQPKPCAIGSVYQPSAENIQFYATQAFTHAPEALKVIGKDQVLHIGKLEDAALRHCNRSLQKAVSESGMSATFASDNCLMGLYIPTLLTLSYGFRRNTTNIKLASTIGEARIDWSLGAMLVELSSLLGPAHFAVTCNTTGSSIAVFAKTLDRGNFAMSVHTWTPSVVLFLSLMYSYL